MEKEFSKSWISSSQPRKQRKYRYNASLHLRHKMLAAHLSKDLRKEYKKRSLPLRKGDEVLVMRGSFRRMRGKISRVDLKALKVYVDSVKRKKPSGQDVEAAMDPSNVMITKLQLEDKERKKILERKQDRTKTKTGAEK